MTSVLARPSSMRAAWWVRSIGAIVISCIPVAHAHAATPQIRTSSANTVPACVTPQRLMSFLKSRNRRLSPHFEHIAEYYRRHGEAWSVRWDYAFFQMAVETNFLTYKRGNGRWGDVNPKQNNFAGLGTTGGGVPGDSYPDVSTGVLAQIQHLVVYSGQRIANPAGHRTRLKQDAILETTAHLKGRMTFADLSRRWAADKRYGASIEWVASRFRKAYCTGRMAKAAPPAPSRIALPRATSLGGPNGAPRRAAPSPVRTVWSRSDPSLRLSSDAPQAAAPKLKPAHNVPRAPAMPEKAAPARAKQKPATVAAAQQISVPAPVEMHARPSRPEPPAARKGPRAFAFGAAMAATHASALEASQANTDAQRCRVLAASYGGKKTLLVRATANNEVHYTALTVLDGFETSMLEGYLKVHAPGGESLGAFESKDAALSKARELCPGSRAASMAGSAKAG